MVVTVAWAPSCWWAATRPLITSGVMSGTSPLRMRTVVSGCSSWGAAARTASPVPRASCCTASSTPSGRIGSSARSGPPTTMTFAAPACRAAWTGQSTIGHPQIGCRTFGVSDRMRVPWPAARTTAIGAGMGRHGRTPGMPAYVVVNIRIHDRDLYAEYARGAPGTVARFGGRYVARGGAVEVREGSWSPERLVILEFPDLDAAHAWYESPEYTELRAVRERASEGELVITEGLDA